MRLLFDRESSLGYPQPTKPPFFPAPQERRLALTDESSCQRTRPTTTDQLYFDRQPTASKTSSELGEAKKIRRCLLRYVNAFGCHRTCSRSPLWMLEHEGEPEQFLPVAYIVIWRGSTKNEGQSRRCPPLPPFARSKTLPRIYI